MRNFRSSFASYEVLQLQNLRCALMSIFFVLAQLTFLFDIFFVVKLALRF